MVLKAVYKHIFNLTSVTCFYLYLGTPKIVITEPDIIYFKIKHINLKHPELSDCDHNK